MAADSVMSPVGEGSTPASAGSSFAVEVSGLRKEYGGIVALDGVDLAVEPGTIHAIVGENGAGKSTLMKILAGAVSPDAGEVRVGGTPVTFSAPHDARRQGIGIVYQELSLFPDRSILANLFVGSEPTRRGFIDRRAMHERARPVLARLGLRVDPSTTVGRLGVGQQQLVELSRLLIERPAVLILDEPNSALDEAETRRLFGILRELTAEGVTILYVSHRLEEVFAIADRITVMRNGQVVFTRERASLTIPEVVRAMVGGAQEALFPPREAAPVTTRSALTITDLRVEGELYAVSLTAAPGTIVGLAGLEGSGVATLLAVLFGLRRASSGTVTFPDGAGLPASPAAAARRRISMVPADRRHDGVMLEASIAQNIAQVAIGALGGRFWLRDRDLIEPARRQIRDLQIAARSPAMPVGQLSGGNQQKVVVGKWLEITPNVMLLDDPTRGVDVGAKREIYGLIRRLAAEGRVILFRSTELPELVGLADRIIVFHRGHVAGEVEGGAIDDHGLLHAINTGELRAVPAATAPQ
jgi:ABC-type sugar transport system ATPase subunit